MPKLRELNIGLAAIGSGTPYMAVNFQKESQFPGALYVDQNRQVYNAMGCNRGLKYVLNTRSLSSISKAVGEGYTQGIKQQGDGLQLGGVFVISKTKGILFQHVEEYIGHHADLEKLLEACTLAKSQLAE